MTKITKMTAAMILVLTAMLANSIPVGAQEPAAPTVGAWEAIKALPSKEELTVKLKGGGSKKGNLADATDTALTLSQGKKITEIRRDGIFQIYRLTPKSRKAGTATGAAAGGGLMLLGGISEDLDPRFTLVQVAIWTGLGALIGRGIARSHKQVLIYEARR